MKCRCIGRRIPVIAACVALAAAMSWSTVSLAQVKLPRLKLAAPPAEKAKPGEKADPAVVPDGTPDELIAYIKKLSEEQPPQDAPEEALKEFITVRLRAMATAGSKILSGKPNEDQAMAATPARLSSLVQLQSLGDAAAAKQVAGMPAELTAAGFPKLARAVSGALLQRRLQEAQTAGPEEIKKVVELIAKHLAAAPLERTDVGLAIRATMMLEGTGDAKLAADAYASFGKLLSADKDKKIAGFGARMEGAARRLRLPGNPMDVEGTLLGGKKLDWSKFQKKTVLVMFWATWCEPCNIEIPNVKELYQQYHAKGFDVVGISCDDDQKKLEEFVREKEIPWPVLFSNTPEATGMDTPMATKYGIIGIPTMILVGPDGKVISPEARGPELARELAKIYGPAEKPAEKPATKPAEKPAAKKVEKKG